MSHPKVFISYSQDSEAHRERVRGLHASLARDGIAASLDAYKDTDEDWPLWMSRQLEEADFILCVITETYARRFRDRELPEVGLGVGWEAGLIRRLLYGKKLHNDRIFPVLFAGEDRPHIPLELQGYDYFLLNGVAGYENLLRKLLGQPLLSPPNIGTAPSFHSTTTAPLFARPGEAAPSASPAPAAPSANLRPQLAQHFKEMVASFDATPAIQSARAMLDSYAVLPVELFLQGPRRPGQRVEVTAEMVRVALAEEDPDDHPREAIYNGIRDCFDAYFDALEPFDSDIRDGLLDEEHVMRKFSYWIQQFADETASLKGANFVRAARRYVQRYYPGEIQSLCARAGCGFSSPETGRTESASAQIVPGDQTMQRPPSALAAAASDGGAEAQNLWRRKLAFLQNEEARAADPEQKFSLQVRIEEARAKIQELGG